MFFDSQNPVLLLIPWTILLVFVLSGLLKLTLEKARQRSIHEVYMSVNKDNPASLRVQMKNGAYIHHENETKFFTRINLIEVEEGGEQ